MKIFLLTYSLLKIKKDLASDCLYQSTRKVLNVIIKSEINVNKNSRYTLNIKEHSNRLNVPTDPYKSLRQIRYIRHLILLLSYPSGKDLQLSS